MSSFDVFSISFFAVAVLLLTAVPGYLLIRTKCLPENTIQSLSKILVFICQPCLAVYTFSSTEFSVGKLCDVGVFALLCLGINAIMMGASYLVLKKHHKNAVARIATVATTLGNCAFFGIPILEALYGEGNELIIYTTVYAVVMNVIGWTLASAIMSGDMRYVSLKKILVNPALIGAAVALIIFCFRIPLSFDLPFTDIRFGILESTLTITARMATPISMIVMGMRLATMDARAMFLSPAVYLTVFVKQMIMPLVAFAMVYFLPIDPMMKCAFYVISACPVASVVLNYAEMCGSGQKEAASMLLLGTILSSVTLPCMMLLLGYLG